MVRTASADHIFAFPFELERYVSDFEISYKQKDVVILRKSKADIANGSVEIAGNDIRVFLNPSETKMFKKGYAYAQVVVKTQNGKIVPSEEVTFDVEDALDEEGGFDGDEI